MKKIEEIDENFKAVATDRGDTDFYDVKKGGFSLFGLPHTDAKSFKRLPDEIAKNTNPGVAALYTNTSGGRVVFKTDSPYIAIRAEMPDVIHFAHMATTGVSGFDLYADEGDGFSYRGTFVPPHENFASQKGYEAVVKLGGKRMRKVMIGFPLYNNVDNLYIGLEKECEPGKYNPYKDVAPIYYYGSSITQGGCASRPGNCYPAIISRKNNIDFVCLGFSGSAHGERIMAEYIAEQNMSAFVLDFDYNAANEEELKERHYPFYEVIRNKQPKLPIVMVTAPVPDYKRKSFEKRREIIFKSYEKAKLQGDSDVYFVDGSAFYTGEESDIATVDGCHPNDYGFSRMAEQIIKPLTKVL